MNMHHDFQKNDAPQNLNSHELIHHAPSSLQSTSPETSQRENNPSFLIELFKFALIAVLFVLPIRLYIAQPFIVSGSSMEPTFSNGEYLIVDELSYNFTAPERGDVIIFKFPEDTTKYFIKRVIGLPNETVSMNNGVINISSNSYPEGITISEPYIAENSQNTFIKTLNQNEYFVLGDNRNASSDSRTWGPLQEDLIVGRAFLRLLPIAEASILPGKFK